MRSRLHVLGAFSAAILALLWAAFLYAVVGFGKGMSGAKPNLDDYLGVFLWPGTIGFAVTIALAFAAWTYRSAAWLACGLAILALLFMMSFLI